MKLPEFYDLGSQWYLYSIYDAHIIISNTLHGGHITIIKLLLLTVLFRIK